MVAADQPTHAGGFMQFYSYVTTDPKVPGMADDPLASAPRAVDRDLKTLKGVVRRLKRAWPGRCFKVFSFTNIYDNSTFKLVHIEIP
jgi:hypothetical protein